jgi:hypothetical protein
MKSRSAHHNAFSRLGLPLIVTAFLSLIIPSPVRADLVISVQSVTATAGTTGDSLDITLNNTGPNAVTVGGFSFEVTAATSVINFTAATTGTSTAPYIFDGNSLFGPTISTSTGQTLDASDSFSIINSGTTVGSGATLGLGHLLFNVASGAPTGPVAVTLTSFPATSLSSPAGGNLTINSLVNGTITVNGSSNSVVPEPSTLISAALGISISAWISWRSRRRTGTTVA